MKFILTEATYQKKGADTIKKVFGFSLGLNVPCIEAHTGISCKTAYSLPAIIEFDVVYIFKYFLPIFLLGPS